MKKKLTVLFIFMISLFSAFQFAFAGAFTGTVTGSVADPDTQKGTITVTGAPSGGTLKLYLAKDNSLKGTQPGTSYTFTGLDPGKYYVTSTDSSAQESDHSSTVDVKPSATNLVLTSDVGTTQIRVTGGIPGAKFTLYNESDPSFNKRIVTAANDGSQTFTDVPVGKNYRVTQTVNDAESALSTNGVDILPNKVTAIPEDAGATNDQGKITVTGGKIGNTLNLYDKNNTKTPIKSITLVSADSYTFTGLPSGTYYVIQVQDGLASLQSEDAVISDHQAPTLTLNGTDVVRLTYGDSYTDAGVTVIDNTDTNPTIITDGLNNITTTALPGTYTITYSAKDKNGNQSTKITRTVIIAPKKIYIQGKKDTNDDLPPNRAYGDIIINSVMAGATLYLYQDNPDDTNDTNDTLIKTILDANAGGMTIKEVPVGKDYYFIQKVNNIQSDPSDRVDILDTTNPNLTLNGNSAIELVVDDRYIEQGATATDNVDTTGELKVVINETPTIDTKKPGIYIVTYNVSDKAGNSAVQVSRTITIKPQAVTVVGSTAELGEISVTKAMPSEINNSTILTLYKMGANKNFTELATATLTAGETTHVFKKYGPGSYYVTQTINNQESAPSNVVDIVDIDRPYITLIGPEKLSFLWDEDKFPYYNGSGVTKSYIDPGATAKDYIDGDLTALIDTRLTTPSDSTGATIDNNPKRHVTFSEPGLYTITYSVKATSRDVFADEKKRTITIAPPKTATPISAAGTSVITVSSVYNHATTIVKLYNTYNQLIDTIDAQNLNTATFEEVPAGIGYYVTQTVNGIESAPSDPVNISLYSDASFVGFTSFKMKGFSEQGVINEGNGTITVTLPYGTSKTSLTPEFTLTDGATVKVNSTTQTSGTSTQNFTSPVTYTVSKGLQSNTYKVTVVVAKSATSVWKDTFKKDIQLTENQKVFSLSSVEKALAIEEGISFIAEDLAFHISAATIRESNSPALTLTDVKESTFVTFNDPSWKNNLSNIVEIGWGGSTAPFLQPIEVEMLNPDNQLFVKLIRENNTLYAIVQPREKINGKIVGLATEPGIYALLDGIDPPTIYTRNQNGELAYGLISGLTGASIYFTTDSKQISFNRSARNPNLSDYLFTGKPSDLLNWNKYNTLFTIPNDELYAVVMQNQIISTVRTLKPKAAIDWRNDIPNVSRYKTWKIQLNDKIDKKSIFSGAIYVTDDSTEERVNTLLQLSPDGKTITITPAQPYGLNKQYTLWIEGQIKGSTTKEFLKQPFKMTFKTN